MSEIILPHLKRWVSRLTGPQQPVNSYLWERAGGTVVIDPAADVPVVPGVTDVFVTHVQEEHAVGAARFPQARVHVPAGDEYLCAGPAAYEKLITTWPAPWEWETRGNYLGHLGGARNERPLRVPVAVDADWSGVKFLATPGHGKNARTILAEMDGQRVAFCGDLIFEDGRLWNWFDADWDYGMGEGYRALLASVELLLKEPVDWLCPTHGAPIREPRAALEKLRENFLTALRPPGEAFDYSTIAFPTSPSPASGFRQLLPQLHQWELNGGNCAVLLSESGHALLVDDGLCSWKPLPERAAHHREVIASLKQALGIRRIEMVIPTHYHGDHIENIPELVALEGAEVVCLDLVADVMEYPERFNLACALPWYGTNYRTVPVNRRVAAGTRIRWREYELEIFHLAGQTYYHAGIATQIGNKRVMFVGDSFNAHAGVEGLLCYNDHEPARRGWAFALDRIAERKPDLLVCGHVGVVGQPMPLVEIKRRLWRDQLARYARLSARADLRLFFDPFIGSETPR